MAKPEERAEAERLYVQESKTCEQIAGELGVAVSTVYDWRKAAAESGEGFNWDVQRRVYNLSPREMIGMYAESVKKWLLEIRQDPQALSDPKIADAISKHISVMQRLDNRKAYMGAALDLIKVANRYLSENAPELKKKMDDHWDGIYQYLADYTSSKGLF